MEKIKTLEDGTYSKHSYKGGIIVSQQSNSYQYYSIDDGYYLEVGSKGRGYVPEVGEGAFVYDVAANPDCNDEFRSKLLGVLKNKIENELVSINKLISVVNKERDMNVRKLKIEEII